MPVYMCVQVRERIADGIERDLSLRSRLSAYEIQGRVKSVLSAFKKVFRQVAPLTTSKPFRRSFLWH